MQKGIIVFYFFLFFLNSVKPVIAEEIERGSFQQPGLGLETIAKKVIKKESVPNYHMEQMKCSDCHGVKPNIAKDKSGTVKLIKNNINELCDKCHDGENLHPISIVPSEVKVSDDLPLDTRGKNKGKITCITCHAIHLNDAYNYLLRGFPLSNIDGDASILKSEQKIFFKDRQDLCKSCHEKMFLEKNPHNRQSKSCTFCHTKDPKEVTEKEVLEISRTFKKDIVKLCNFCHSKTREAHYLAVNPFYDKDLKKEISMANIVLINGKTICVSCHDPHGTTKQPFNLRDNYIKLSEKSKRINPHWTETFCLCCHKEKDDGKLELKFNGDYNKICNECHETNEARANIHPVGKVPRIRKNLKIINDLPLQEGRLTCLTCHDVRKQEKNDKKEKETNPYFLNNILAKDKKEICFKCHIQEKFSETNAHDQVTDEGEVNEEICIYCHISRPDREVIGLEDIDPTIEDLSFLCSRCHNDGPHPAKTNHLVKLPEAKLERKLHYESINNVIYPLDARKRIFCGTCHNVHESGIVKNKKAAKGADQSNRVRLPLLKGELCIMCHEKETGFKYIENRSFDSIKIH
ncbi:hypothetical protein HY745_02725 [Candidatus Desantisbacteria bacterium]|nr:hypothetical protein [Candidatus Desantisbacteria bacterium]